MFRTATNVCTGEVEKMESLNLARQIATSDGYKKVTNRTRLKREVASRNSLRHMSKVPFYLPFFSDEISLAVKRCLKRAGLEDSVGIIELPPNNLRRQLVRNRMYDRLCATEGCIICPNGRDGDCMSSGTIYLISCNTCGHEYIGETGRPLYIRIKEHLDGKQKTRLSTPLGAHRAQKHNGDDFGVKVVILAHEPKTSARKTLEAFWITAKDPKINRKEEYVVITRDLVPYLGLIF